MTDDLEKLRAEVREGVLAKLSEAQTWPSEEEWPISPNVVIDAAFDATAAGVFSAMGLVTSGPRRGDAVQHPNLGEVTFLMAHGGRAFVDHDGVGQCVSLDRLTKVPPK